MGIGTLRRYHERYQVVDQLNPPMDPVQPDVTAPARQEEPDQLNPPMDPVQPDGAKSAAPAVQAKAAAKAKKE